MSRRTVVNCDRCGADITRTYKGFISITRTASIEIFHLDTIDRVEGRKKEKELCTRCTDELLKWLESEVQENDR